MKIIPLKLARILLSFTLLLTLLLWATAASASGGRPPVIPSTEDYYAIPQPVVVEMYSGKYDVYSGPSRYYYREANGKACVSTNEWIQCFGRDGDWALIQYRVSGSKLRFGYVYRDAFRRFDSLPVLSFEYGTLFEDHLYLTSDPLGQCEMMELVGDYPVTRLAMLGDTWMYVEITLPNDHPTRMFMEASAGDDAHG